MKNLYTAFLMQKITIYITVLCLKNHYISSVPAENWPIACIKIYKLREG